MTDSCVFRGWAVVHANGAIMPTTISWRRSGAIGACRKVVNPELSWRYLRRRWGLRAVRVVVTADGEEVRP